MFYPGDALHLASEIDGYLAEARAAGTVPKAIIVPHAGTIYSGPVAASAYAALKKAAGQIERVVLLGPAHRVGFRGIAAPGVQYFETPLRTVAVDTAVVRQLAEQFPQVIIDDWPHAEEHSLEVQLPFLQETLRDFNIVPLVVGQATPEEVAEVIRALWGGPETLIVISSDLSHYHDYATAIARDTKTAKAIETLHGERIGPEDACGFLPVRGLLEVAREKGLHAVTVDQRNSGDTAGTKDRVVGYGAWLFV